MAVWHKQIQLKREGQAAESIPYESLKIQVCRVLIGCCETLETVDLVPG